MVSIFFSIIPILDQSRVNNLYPLISTYSPYITPIIPVVSILFSIIPAVYLSRVSMFAEAAQGTVKAKLLPVKLEGRQVAMCWNIDLI